MWDMALQYAFVPSAKRLPVRYMKYIGYDFEISICDLIQSNSMKIQHKVSHSNALVAFASVYTLREMKLINM